jgi:hypothetical protein
MKRLINIFLIIFTASTLFAQKIDSKIDKLIELQKEHPDYVTNSQTELMGDLIDYILKKNHGGEYKKYYVPFELDSLNYGDKTYYYKTANITIFKKLFYWGYKNDKERWVLNSIILDSLNMSSADYKLSMFSDMEQEVSVFKSHEANFLLTNDLDKNTLRIDYDFYELKDYNFVYVETRIENGKIKWSSERNQNIFNDETLDSLMQELKNTRGDYEKQQNLLKSIESRTDKIKDKSDNDKSIYLTELQVNDINGDDKIDYYWAAISDGKIIYYEVINLVDSEWVNLSKNFDSVLLMNNDKIKKHIEILN